MPAAQQTAFARLTEVPAPTVAATNTPLPTATAPGSNSATLAAGNANRSVTAVSTAPPPSMSTASTMPTANAAPPTPAAPTQPVTPVPVTEVPPLGANGPMGGMSYTNPTRTFRFVVPMGWSPPMPDGSQASRVVTRAPGDAVTLTVEESMPPDNWQRLPTATVAGILDRDYRAANPGSMLQGAVLTGVRGLGDLGLATYRFTYNTNVNNAPAIVERFVTLTFTGGVTTTATGAPDAYNAAKPTVEAVVGSLEPLKQDQPTPAALAPVSGGTVMAGGVTKTASGLSLTLPMGWTTIAIPAQPPDVEFVAQSADKTQTVRVVRKMIPEGMTVDDFASTAAEEFKASTQGYNVDDEGENTISGQHAVRVTYNAMVNGQPVEGQSVTLAKGGVGYVVMVEVPMSQYTDHQDDSQALFDRIEGSVTLP